MNIVDEEKLDTLVLIGHSLVDDWMLSSGISFHNTSHQEIIENYVIDDSGNMCTDAGGESYVVEWAMWKSYF